MIRPTYPRVNCLVPGCKRGTTRCAPHDDGTQVEIICGKHWRTVPKSWRTAMTFCRRRLAVAERKGDQLGMDKATRLWWRGWDRIVAMLRAPDSVMQDDLPATMAEALRREGLL